MRRRSLHTSVGEEVMDGEIVEKNDYQGNRLRQNRRDVQPIAQAKVDQEREQRTADTRDVEAQAARTPGTLMPR